MLKNKRILIICSVNSGNISPFVTEQVNMLIGFGYNIEFFKVKGKGIGGYIRNFFLLQKRIKYYKPNVLHAHYGLSALLAFLHKKTPLIITYHGSDLNNKYVRILSNLASYSSDFLIFVEQSMAKKINFKKKFSVVPCGVDLDFFKPIGKKEARLKLGIKEDEKLLLFSSSFDNEIKNFALVKEAIKLITSDICIVELKQKSREEVMLLLNAVNVLILSSFSEGSPQIIKEAMACNCPIVATDVGDVRLVLGCTDGCYISSFSSSDFASKITLALEFSNKYKYTNGRERIVELGLDNRIIAERIATIYEQITNRS